MSLPIKRTGSPSLELPPAKRRSVEAPSFTVVVAGREFVLSRAQVETDAPNLLSRSLLVRCAALAGSDGTGRLARGG